MDGPKARHAEDAVHGIKPMIGFDSAQILRFTPSGIPEEVCRIGYSPHTASALLTAFPRMYPPGFSSRANPHAPHLPATISTSESEFRATFVRSSIWRDNLLRDGYLDGMSVELSISGLPIGLAHFSSRTPDFFTRERKETAFSISGLLAHFAAAELRGLPDESRNAELQGWHTEEIPLDPAHTPAVRTPLNADDSFVRNLPYLSRLNKPVSHLWKIGNNLHEVTIDGEDNSRVVKVSSRPADKERYFEATIQELQVLSCLCCGLSNADIAGRLHISPRTVHSHMEALRRKSGAANRVELTVIALSTGAFIPHPAWAPVEQILRPVPYPEG